MGEVKTTPFSTIYDSFFSRVTDDLYIELTPQDTEMQLQDILLAAIPAFEFPRFNVFDYQLGELQTTETGESTTHTWVGGFFNSELTREEVNILSLAMVVEWIGRQLTIIDLARQRFSGSDFKMTSQANHMAKLKEIKNQYATECFHMQRLYKRRIVTENGIQSTIGQIMSEPNYGYKI